MEKIIFIIGSEHYSKDLLSRCLEKYAKATCYHFFSKEEMMLYLDLKPNIIIGEGETFRLAKSNVMTIRRKLESMPQVIAVFNDRIEVSSIRQNGLKGIQKLKYNNLYSSLSALVDSDNTEKSSSMMMY